MTPQKNHLQESRCAVATLQSVRTLSKQNPDVCDMICVDMRRSKSKLNAATNGMGGFSSALERGDIPPAASGSLIRFRVKSCKKLDQTRPAQQTRRSFWLIALKRLLVDQNMRKGTADVF